MVGQLQLLDLQEADGGVEAIRELIVSKRDELIDAANQHCKRWNPCSVLLPVVFTLFFGLYILYFALYILRKLLNEKIICSSMVKRGGGVSDLQARMINPSDDRKPYLIIHIKVQEKLTKELWIAFILFYP